MSWKSWWLAVLLVASAAWGFASYATRPSFLLGDGPQMLALFDRTEPFHAPLWTHMGVFTWAWCVSTLGPSLSSLDALVASQSLAATLGLVLLAQTVVRVGGGGWRSLALWCTAATAPALWLHGHVVEVHGMQFAATALVLWTLVCIHRQLPTVFLVGAVWCIVAFVGQTLHRSSVLLLPGVGVAAWCLEGRVPGRLRRAFAVVVGFAVAFLAASWASVTTVLAVTHGWSGFEQAWWQVAEFGGSWSAAWLVEEWLTAIPAALVLAVMALLGAAPCRAWIAVAALPTTFFLYFGESTAGGYALGLLPIYVVAGATVLRDARLLTSVVVVAALVVQVGLLFRAEHSVERSVLEEHSLARVDAARQALPDGGLLISAGVDLQAVTGRGVNVVEVGLASTIAARPGVPPDVIATTVANQMSEYLTRPDAALAFDPGWRSRPGLVEYLEAPLVALEREIEHRFALRSVSAAGLTYWRLQLPGR